MTKFKAKELELEYGQMEINMKENILMAYGMVKEFSNW